MERFRCLIQYSLTASYGYIESLYFMFCKIFVFGHFFKEKDEKSALVAFHLSPCPGGYPITLGMTKP